MILEKKKNKFVIFLVECKSVDGAIIARYIYNDNDNRRFFALPIITRREKYGQKIELTN